MALKLDNYESDVSVSSNYSCASIYNRKYDLREIKIKSRNLKKLYKLWLNFWRILDNAAEMVIYFYHIQILIIFVSLSLAIGFILLIYYVEIYSRFALKAWHIMKFVAWMMFLTYVGYSMKTIFQWKQRYRSTSTMTKTVFRWVLQYSCVIEFTCFNICVSYFFRCMSETFIRQNGNFITDPLKIFSNCCVIIIMFLAFITSNDPENVRFVKVFLLYLAIIIVSERMTIHGELLGLLSTVCASIIMWFMKLMMHFCRTLLGSALLNIPAILLLLQLIIVGSLCSLTNFFFVYDLLGSLNDKGEFYIPCDIAIVTIVIFTFFANSTLAFFISLPMLPCLTNNELHFLLCAFLSAPVVHESPHFYRSIPIKIISSQFIIILPTLWMMCSLSAPKAKSVSDSFHLAFPFDVRTFQSQHAGFRTMTIFSRKLASKLLAVEVAIVCLRDISMQSFRYIITTLSGINPLLFEPSIIVGVIILPIINCIALPRTDTLMVSYICIDYNSKRCKDVLVHYCRPSTRKFSS